MLKCNCCGWIFDPIDVFVYTEPDSGVRNVHCPICDETEHEEYEEEEENEDDLEIHTGNL